MTDELELTPEARQTARLAGVPAIYRQKHERLAYELALRMEDPALTFARYGYDEAAAATLMESVVFAALLDRVAKDVIENGLSFRAKARTQAEELLEHSFEMATDPTTSAAVRADLIKWTSKMGGLEPKEKDDGKSVGGGMVLNITFTGQQPTVTREPITITQEA